MACPKVVRMAPGLGNSMPRVARTASGQGHGMPSQVLRNSPVLGHSIPPSAGSIPEARPWLFPSRDEAMLCLN